MRTALRVAATNRTVFATCISLLGLACSGGGTEPFPPPVGGAPSGVGGSVAGSPTTPGAAGGISVTGGSSSGGTAPAGGGAPGTSGGAPTGSGGRPIVQGGSTGNPLPSGGTTAAAGAVSAGSTSGGAASTAGAASGGGAPPSAGGEYNPEFKEFYGADCTVADPADVDESTLPDLFKKLDGTRMTTKAEWRCRRAELKKIVEKYIHGEKPGTPEEVTGTVSSTSITVNVKHGGKSTSFSVMFSIPSGAPKPAPLILGLGGSSLRKSILDQEGVALGNYNHNQIASETSRSGKFTEIYGNTGASAQVAWAWGVSRIIDVLVSEKAAGRNDIIDPKAIGVTGCSRNGKGAFTVGAFDERIALGIPQESGTGGVSAFRIVNTSPMGPNGKPAQSLDSAWSEAQGWFGTVFGTYRSKVNTIPGDTHSLVAMYAPRGLLVLDNSRIGELGSSAQHAASAAGALVYKALGVEGNIAYHGGNPNDPHNHCSFYDSQAEPLKKAIRAFLTKKDPPAGKIEPQPAGTADLAKWITWEAPALQ